MHFGLMPEKGTIDPMLILRKLQNEYRIIGKMLHVHFFDSGEDFDRVPRKLFEWAMKMNE